MKNTFLLLLVIASACVNANTNSPQPPKKKTLQTKAATAKAARVRHFAGAFSNGMKGDSIFFDVSADGKLLQNLTFKGYWRCSGKLEQMTAGPEGAFALSAGQVDGHITEPPNGGATAWRFDLKAGIQGEKASGTFRMNINNLGCDTYLLQWTAIER